MSEIPNDILCPEMLFVVCFWIKVIFRTNVFLTLKVRNYQKGFVFVIAMTFSVQRFFFVKLT